MYRLHLSVEYGLWFTILMWLQIYVFFTLQGGMPTVGIHPLLFCTQKQFYKYYRNL